MSAKHTPGPWACVSGADQGAFTVYLPSDGMVICSRNPYESKHAEFLANARLIAAAPTTAQMAMDFTLLVERYVRDDTGLPTVSDAELADALYALRAHIAKATGGAT